MDAYTSYWRDRVCGLFGCNSINMNDYDDESSALAHQQELEHQAWERHKKASQDLMKILEELKNDRYTESTTEAASGARN